MLNRATVLALALGLGIPPSRFSLPPPLVLSPRDSALHALNRLAYGPRPGEIDRVARIGVMRWIDQQLEPNRIDNQPLEQRERQFEVLRLDRADLARRFVAAREERQQRMQGNRTATDSMHAQDDPGPKEKAGRRLGGQVQELAVVRAALSERQLYEVMVDFWTNHFNVFFGKGADRYLLPDYIERVIRPRAMGKFEDLLVATAESPAMMFYLDNWESVVPGATPPHLGFARMVRPQATANALKQMPKGINENYARELLELHTLGVDGGYTQQDVINVARIFTGWSIERPKLGGGFTFRDWAHDRGQKVVMGVTYPAGEGMEEGVRLLKWLATAEATMHHVSRELCERLVNDNPPDGCVDDAVLAWRSTGGDIREVLRAIFHGPDFWAAANVRVKVKTPLEFVVSALRAVGADPDTTPKLAQVVAHLGEPLYLHVAPDGYPEQQEAWVNSGALLDRMNAAVGLAAGKLPGAEVELDSLIEPTPDVTALISAVDARILGGTMTAHTREVLERELADIRAPRQARAFAVGLALGGPEFQRQ